MPEKCPRDISDSGSHIPLSDPSAESAKSLRLDTHIV